MFTAQDSVTCEGRMFTAQDSVTGTDCVFTAQDSVTGVDCMFTAQDSVTGVVSIVSVFACECVSGGRGQPVDLCNYIDGPTDSR